MRTWIVQFIIEADNLQDAMAQADHVLAGDQLIDFNIASLPRPVEPKKEDKDKNER